MATGTDTTPATEAPEGVRTGEHRDPIFVAVLGVVTFGVYFWYWLWSSAESAERFDERSVSPFDTARWAVPLHALGTVGVWFAALQAWNTLPDGVTESGVAQFQDELIGLAIAAGVFALIALVGAFGLLFAQRRLWKLVERHEHALDEPNPIRPGRMTLLVLLPVIPVVNVLTLVFLPFIYGYLLHRTQRGLNRIWEATREGYRPEHAWRTAEMETAQPSQAGPSGSAGPAQEAAPPSSDEEAQA